MTDLDSTPSVEQVKMTEEPEKSTENYDALVTEIKVIEPSALVQQTDKTGEQSGSSFMPTSMAGHVVDALTKSNNPTMEITSSQDVHDAAEPASPPTDQNQSQLQGIDCNESKNSQPITVRDGDFPRPEPMNHITSHQRKLALAAFIRAAENGARACVEEVVMSGKGKVDSHKLGRQIVANSDLHIGQRRCKRLLPGGDGLTTAACYMIGWLSDGELSEMLNNICPTRPREERCKVVELKLKVPVCRLLRALNKDFESGSCAEKLAAVRICDIMSDIIAAYVARDAIESRKKLLEKIEELGLRV